MPSDAFEASWASYISMNPRLRDSRMLTKMMRAGVPAEFRAEAWTHCLGLDASAISASGTHEDGDLPEGVTELIDADVARTFPNSDDFQAAGGAPRLRSVLHRLALMDAELGYCQSLNFIGAVFLMGLHDEHVAVAAIRQILLKLGVRRWYTHGMQQLRADTLVLEELIRERLPAVHATFKAVNFDLLFISSKWFLCLFSTVLEEAAMWRVWDAIVVDGIESVFRVALAMLALRQEDIAGAESLDQLFRMFQEKQDKFSDRALLRMAYSPSLLGLTKQELAQRRQQAAQKVQQMDTRDEMRRMQLWRGGIRPASVLSRH